VHHASNYVEITLTDMDAAQHFYGTAFGWRWLCAWTDVAETASNLIRSISLAVSVRRRTELTWQRVNS
jgi:hypothetical protein